MNKTNLCEAMTDNISAALSENRDKIDQIDAKLVALLNERVALDAGYTESEILDQITLYNQGPLTNDSLHAIYRAFMLEGQTKTVTRLSKEEIDERDHLIVSLLNQRVCCASAIGKIKHARGADYYDPSREAQVMDKVTHLNNGPVSAERLRSVYREIISSSISLEKRLVIAYLGPESTYTHQAAIQNFGVSLQYKAARTIPDVFSSVSKGEADYGVVPIENSTEGAVFHSMDMLVETDLVICSQIYLPIEHCLISSGNLDSIREVRSKDQALGQCREWLQRGLPEANLVDVVSTAEAVRAAKADSAIAAVASELSARHFDVPVVAKSIQDRSDNVTRFLVIGKTHAQPLGKNRDRTSLVITLPDTCGALEGALRTFASRGINLSKIESRPSRKKAWDYYFFIDLVGHFKDEAIQEAFEELRASCSFVKWLGSYPNQ